MCYLHSDKIQNHNHIMIIKLWYFKTIYFTTNHIFYANLFILFKRKPLSINLCFDRDFYAQTILILLWFAFVYFYL